MAITIEPPSLEEIGEDVGELTVKCMGPVPKQMWDDWYGCDMGQRLEEAVAAGLLVLEPAKPFYWDAGYRRNRDDWLFDTLPHPERVIIRMLAQLGDFARADIIKIGDVSECEACTMVKMMKRRGLVVRTGTGKKTRYQLRIR